MTMQPDPHRSEMMEVVMTVVGSLNEIISALRAEVAVFTENEKNSRQRMDLKLAMIAIAILISLAGVGLNYRQGQNIKTVVSYVEDCSKPDGACKKRSNDAIAGAIHSISGAVFDATACVQALPLAERTDAIIKACRDKYIQ